MFSVVNAYFPSAPILPLHQSHDALPALIHETSFTAAGGFKFIMAFDSISFPGVLPIISTRHADCKADFAVTATSGRSILGANLDSSVCPDHPPDGLVRYIEE